MSERDSGQPISIGVVHLNQLGDLLFSLPVLTSLREAFPRGRVLSIVKEPLEPLLAPSPLVDGVILHRGSRDFFASLGRVRAAQLDLTVCLSQSPRSRLLAYASGAERRVGFSGGPLESLQTESVEKVGMPSTANNLRLARAMGWTTPDETYQGLLTATATDRAAAGALLEEAGWDGESKILVISGSASQRREEKEWSTGRFVEVAHSVAALGACSAFVGTSRPEGLQHVPDEGVLDLTGRTGLRDLVGLLDLADSFVGIDSGVLHLAAAVGKPCVALFGPTDPEQTGPQGTGHVVVRAAEDGLGEMDAIPVGRVSEAVADVLGRTG